MLQKLREQKDSVFIAVLFGIIIIVFVFMFGLPGVDSCASKRQSDMGHMGSHNITSELTRSMIHRYHDDNVFSSKNYAAVARQTAYGIAVVYLLADEARKAGLRVSDDELHYYITDWEAGNSDVFRLGFMQHGKFNKRSYENGLGRINISSHDYENYKREELLARRYLTLLASSVNVSEESLWQDYVQKAAEANIEVVTLSRGAIDATLPALTADDILAYATAHEADIKAYYDGHLGEFTTPPKVKMQQIRIQKDLSNLTNPGEKTVKTYQPNQRFAIAKAQIVENNVDFDQAFTDYDESLNKADRGIYPIQPVGNFAAGIQEALKDKKAGEIVTAELDDVFVIAKVLEATEQIVSPFDDEKFGIATKLLGDSRIKAKTDEVSANIIALVQSGKSMQEALDDALYKDIPTEAPAAPKAAENADANENAEAAETAETAETAENTDAAETAENAEAAEAAPSAPFVALSDRVKARTLEDVSISSAFIAGIGTDEDFARDIRNAADNTLLAKPYQVGMDTVIARVVSHNAPSREIFDMAKDRLREQAVAEKAMILVGNPQDVVSLTGPYGLWVQQKIDQAIQNKQFALNEKYFAREAEARAKQER